MLLRNALKPVLSCREVTGATVERVLCVRAGRGDAAAPGLAQGDWRARLWGLHDPSRGASSREGADVRAGLRRHVYRATFQWTEHRALLLSPLLRETASLAVSFSALGPPLIEGDSTHN